VEYEKKKAWSVSRLARLNAKAEEDAEVEAEAEAEAVEGEAVGGERKVVETTAEEKTAEPTAEALSVLEAENLSTPSTTDKPAKMSGELTEEDYIMIKMKRRVLGNMRFIGELFNIGLISEKIMHAVIVELLRDVTSPEEEEIESLSNLFRTVGPKLDTPAAVKQLDSYVGRMQALTLNLTLSTRIRFMILDRLDERKRKWVGLNQQMPKTLADFQRELEAKQAAKAQRAGPGGAGRDAHRPGSARPPVYQGSNASSASVTNSDYGRRRDDRRDDRRDSGFGRGPSRQQEAPRAAPAAAPGGFTTVSNARGSPALRTATPADRPGSSLSANAPPSNASSIALNRFGALEAAEAASAMALPAWDAKVAGSKLMSGLKEFQQYKKVDEFLAVWTDAIGGHEEYQKPALAFLLCQVLEGGSEAQVNGLHALLEQKEQMGAVLTRQAVGEAFLQALSHLDDLVVDVPRIPEHAGRLIAAAIDSALLPPDAPIRLLGEVAKRDPLPALRTLLHALAAVRMVEARMDQSAMEVIRGKIDIAGPAAFKAKLVPRLPEALQEMLLRDRMASLPEGYEPFLQAARPLLLELDLEAMDQRLVLRSLASPAFARLHKEKAIPSVLESERLPTLIACLSLFPPSATPALLDALLADYLTGDPAWCELAVRAVVAAGLVGPEEMQAWRQEPAAKPALAWI